jgi:hypothetical protein
VSDKAGYEGEIVLEAPVNIGASDAIGALTAKFVRYSGCQQLIIWLPQSGYEGYGAFRIYRDSALIDEQDVRTRLNGSVQILTDTFTWPPGAYRIEITHEGGWRHELNLEKLEEGVIPPPPPAPPPEPKQETPIVYRDGFGKVIPDLDIEMRETLIQKLASKFGRRLEFEGNFRGGTIIYIEGATRIEFYHEMCGGGVHFSIDIPRPDQWESATKTPLSKRNEIVDFVARETQRIQASSWKYVIYENRVDFVD